MNSPKHQRLTRACLTGRAALLLGLVNLPALVLAGWLALSPPAGPALLVPLFALLVALAGNLLLVHLARGASQRDQLDNLETARRAVESANAARTAFLINMSHEFRTPLNGILGLAELLRDRSLSDEHLRNLDLLKASAETLLALVEQVLDFSRLESGEMTLDRQVFSLRQLLADVLAPFTPLARVKGLQLHHHVAPQVPDSFVGDPVRLRQTLTHLVGNAIKFTEHGEVVVRVPRTGAGSVSDGKVRSQEASVADASGSCDLLFEIRDTGIGIPADQQQNIFAPFAQGDPSSTRRHQGMGLGLSIATRLVHLMGGQISLDSAPGKGSTFHVRVKLQPAEPRPRVLLVLSDDERRQNLEQQVRTLGWPIVAVGTGQAGLSEFLQAVVQGSPFGVLLLQETLPDLDTSDWLCQLEDHPTRCPTILLADGDTTPGRLLSRNIACVLPLSPDPQVLRQALLECNWGCCQRASAAPPDALAATE